MIEYVKGVPTEVGNYWLQLTSTTDDDVKDYCFCEVWDINHPFFLHQDDELEHLIASGLYVITKYVPLYPE